MTFFFIAAVFMYIGRKIGWAVSRSFLYVTSVGAAVVASIIWGCVVAVLMFGLIRWQDPNIIVKIIMGYGLGGYVAVPNLGLVREDTISDEAKQRHELLSSLPVVAYILTMAGLSFS
jgi:hypothetical protein